MSKLYGLARQASEYVRNRFQKQYRDADEVVDAVTAANSDYAPQRRSLLGGIRDLLFGRGNGGQDPGGSQPPGPPQPTRPGAPPVQRGGQANWGTLPGSGGGQQPPHRPPPAGAAPGEPEGDDEFGPELGHGDIQLLGRDAGYHEAEFLAVMTGMRRTPGSKNVWGYYFEREARRTGILYVTFLESYRDEVRSGPGPTYAYYDVPVKKALDFQKATAESAGGAVWDYLRIRGTVAGHQHQYRLVHVHGEYVPRKVTPKGYVNRAVPALGIGRRAFRRNTLPPQRFFTRGGPDPGGPDRGEADRGNRGL